MNDLITSDVLVICSFCGGDIEPGEPHYEDGYLSPEDGTACQFCMADILA